MYTDLFFYYFLTVSPLLSQKMREIPTPTGRWTKVIPIVTIQSFPLVQKKWSLHVIGQILLLKPIDVCKQSHVSTYQENKEVMQLAATLAVNLRRLMMLFQR